MDYLLAENLSCIRGSNTVFKNLSFKVSRGQILHITGANGSGKTSLLRMIAGFIDPSDGKIIPEQNYTYKDVYCFGLAKSGDFHRYGGALALKMSTRQELQW